MFVEVLDHRISVSLRKLVDLRQIADVGVSELQEVLAPHEFLLGNLATRRRVTWVHRIAPDAGDSAYFRNLRASGKAYAARHLGSIKKPHFAMPPTAGTVFWVAGGPPRIIAPNQRPPPIDFMETIAISAF
jgi:hypothetical protein